MSPRALRLLALTALATPLSACWSTPDDAASDEAFVAYAIPAVLGRRALSTWEVKALASLHAAEDAEIVLQVLMDQPEFAEYWSHVFLNALRVESEGVFAQEAACYGTPQLDASVYADLVEHVASANADEPFCYEVSPVTGGPDTGDTGDTAAPSAEAHGQEDDHHWDPEELMTKVAEHYDALEAFQESATYRRTKSGRVAAPGIGIHEAGGPQPTGEPHGEEDDHHDDGKGDSGTSWASQKAAASPTTTVCEDFNMTDLLLASIQEDRLDALYRGYLATLAAQAGTDLNAVDLFLKGFVKRDPACLSCHTTTYSTTNPRPHNSEWDRFSPPLGIDTEQGAFNYEDANGLVHGGMGGTEVREMVTGFFHVDQQATTGGTPLLGFHSDCVDGGVLSSWGEDSAGMGLDQATDQGVGALMDALRDGIAAWDLTSYDSMTTTVDPPVETDPAIIEATFNANCAGSCHYPGNPEGAPQDLPWHARRMSPERIQDIATNGSPAKHMPEDMFDTETVLQAVEYLTTHPDHLPPIVYDDGRVAFSQLVAQSVVNEVLREVLGSAFEMDHYFPRNTHQGWAVGSSGVMLQFTDWSFETLLSAILLDVYVNRLSPADSNEDAYVLPPTVNPLAMVNSNVVDTTTGENTNGQGDLVHRWSVISLARQASAAMLWPDPGLYPTGAWPADSLRTAMGEWRSLNLPGFDVVTFNGLLSWEDTNSQCLSKRSDGGLDYVEELVATTDLTAEDAMLGIKSRLVGHPVWWPGEEAMAEALLDGAIFDSGTPALAVDHATALREYCGTLLRSPQFMLAGLPPWPDVIAPLEDEPANLPCVDDTCGGPAWCTYYMDAAVDANITTWTSCP